MRRSKDEASCGNCKHMERTDNESVWSCDILEDFFDGDPMKISPCQYFERSSGMVKTLQNGLFGAMKHLNNQWLYCENRETGTPEQKAYVQGVRTTINFIVYYLGYEVRYNDFMDLWYLAVRKGCDPVYRDLLENMDGVSE